MSWLKRLADRKPKVGRQAEWNAVAGDSQVRWLYVSELRVQDDGPSWHEYLSFDDRGRVKAVYLAFEPGSIDRAAEGFSAIPGQAFSSGRYEIHDHTLDFALSMPKGSVAYKGRIVGERLELHWKSSVTKAEGDTRYWWVRTLDPPAGREDTPLGNQTSAQPAGDTEAAPVVDPAVLEEAKRLQAQAWQRDGQDDLIGAIIGFDRAICANPGDPDSYYGRGVMYCKSRNYTMAVADLDRALRLEPSFPAALAERGLAYAKTEHLVRAMADYDRAIAIDPTYALAHVNKGSAYGLQGQWAEAVVSLSEAIRLDPRHSEAYCNRATAYQQLGDNARAAQDFRAYLRASPQAPATAYAQERLAELEKEHPECRDDAQGAPTAHRIQFTDGSVPPVMGDPGALIAEYDQAIERNPNDPAAYHKRGLARAATGDQAAAIADFDQALALLADPRARSVVYSDRGIARARQGDPIAALADFETAIQQDPANVQAHNNCGNAHSLRGDYAVAVAAYDRAALWAPDFPDTFLNRGSAYYVQGNMSAALADYDRAIEIYPEYADAYFNRAKVHLKSRNLEAALADLRHCLGLRPDAAYAAEVKLLIAKLGAAKRP